MGAMIGASGGVEDLFAVGGDGVVFDAEPLQNLVAASGVQVDPNDFGFLAAVCARRRIAGGHTLSAAFAQVEQSGSIGGKPGIGGVTLGGNLVVAGFIVVPDGAVGGANGGDERLAVGCNGEAVFFGQAGGHLLRGAV